ncbi:MAG TPA: apolipoprotein N-acyltransferase [Gemmatimonadales bacterium]|nr:apolipoprotein N-acyltransferase [Gemmatimonadales bacterium]
MSSTRRAAALVVVGAALLAASYPPFSLPVVSFLAVVPAVILLRRFEQARDPRGAFRWGFWYGFASQGVVLYWLVVALWHFTPLSALGYLATITLFGLWHALLFWFVTRVRLDLPAVPLWVVFPVAWTAVEWAVGHQGDIRFPWLGLGTSLAAAPTLVQWADIAGARGVTLWLAWCNVMVVEGMMGERGALRESLTVPGSGSFRWRPAVALLVTILAAWSYGAWRVRTLPMREVGTVGLIQPNEGFREKWDPGHADSMVAKLVRMSRALEAERHPSLVVWPEAAIPGYFFEHPAWPAAIGGLARETRTPILAGGVYVEFHPGGSYDYYNAAFYFDTAGRWQPYPVYQKHYLVPIVERVPFVPPRWLQLKWFGGFGIGRGLPLYASPLGRFGVMICYESAFEALARGYRRTGAEFLVNITNDAWYGRTAGPYQHATHLVMRAIETRAGIARAANDGISELVDPLGRTSIETGLEREDAVAGVLHTSDVIPLYVRWGDWVGTLVVLLTLGLAGVLGIAASRQGRL